jgi:hypothetical protein
LKVELQTDFLEIYILFLKKVYGICDSGLAKSFLGLYCMIPILFRLYGTNVVRHIQFSFNSIKIFLNEPILSRSASHIQQVLRTFSFKKPYRDLCGKQDRVTYNFVKYSNNLPPRLLFFM